MLIDEIKEIAYRNNSLFQVEIDVTRNCNANCIFCYQGNKHNSINDLNIKEIEQLLLDLKRMGTYIVGYSGGEPFMRKDFIDILKLTKRKGFKTFFITNAQLMSESDIEALVEMAIDKVTVSFHSIYKENYMKIFGIQNPELYDNALKI